jgi:protoporphyrinogen oxidase
MVQRIAILGAGLAGLSAAWGLVARGYDVNIFERDDVVGGLAKSISHEAFTFDIGPHRLLALPGSRVLQLVQELLGDDLRVCQRQSRILKDGKYLDYPLKARSLFANTSFAEHLAALGSFLWSRLRWHVQAPPDSHFENWIVNRFGHVLYETHFRNYTTKLWGLPPTAISADWAAERIAQLTLWDVLQALLWPARRTPRTYASTFYYPLGGIGTIADRLAASVQQSGGTIALHTAVTDIETRADRVVAVRWMDQASGQEGRTEVDGVISTIPLPHLARMCSCNRDLDQAIDGLRYRSLVLVNVLVKRAWLTGDHWLYVPDDRYPFNRLSEPKCFSPDMAPSGWTSVCAEITCDQGDAIWQADPDQLIERVAKSLAQLDLLRLHEVCGGFVTREPQEYPIYTLGYREHRDAILADLGRFTNLHTTGRQGRFQYNNMDHAMDMGLAAAETFVDNVAAPAFTASRQQL